MGRSRLVQPDTTTLQISDGDWIVVWRRLNHGQQRDLYERSRGPDAPDGTIAVDPVKAGVATVLVYLVDWSLGIVDPTLAIRGMSKSYIEGAVDAIDHASFVEILRAIEAHEEAMRAERSAEKNVPSGESNASVISPLPSVAIGALSGSVS